MQSPQAVNTIDKFRSQAQLMGSRGRALKYGRPEPEGRDYDYVVFTDDAKKQQQLMGLLRGLAEQGFRLKDRPGGFLTASGQNMDLSVYPSAKQKDIYRAWELIEAGKSKDEAWDQVEKEKQAAAPAEVILVSGHSGAGKSQTANALAERLGSTHASLDQHPEFKSFIDNDPALEHLEPGWAGKKDLVALLQKLTRETVEKAPAGAIVEGTQLAYLPKEELAAYPKRVYVGGNARQILAQRLVRSKQRAIDKGKAWTPEEADRRKQIGKKVYDLHRQVIEEYRRLPQTHHYNWRKNPDIEQLAAQLKSAAVSFAQFDGDAAVMRTTTLDKELNQ